MTSDDVNQWLINNSSNATNLSSFASDLNSNFLTALTSRFTLSTYQSTTIGALPSWFTNHIATAFQNSVNEWIGASTSLDFVASVAGIYDAPTGNPPSPCPCVTIGIGIGITPAQPGGGKTTVTVSVSVGT
jgi:hypothetical protein